MQRRGGFVISQTLNPISSRCEKCVYWGKKHVIGRSTGAAGAANLTGDIRASRPPSARPAQMAEEVARALDRRGIEDLARGTLLDDRAAVHHDDPVGHSSGKRHLV